MAVAVVDVQVNSQSAVRNLQQVNAASKAATVGINGLKAAIAPLLSVFAAVQAAKFVFVKTAELETQTRSIQTLTGSVKEANRIIKELQAIGAVTPFTSTELIDTAKRLSAFGVSADKVVETTKRLGDVAGATGANLGELSLAYGQVIAKGRLQGEELLQFQERGVALQEVLRNTYKLSAGEFQKALEQGRISSEAVEFALRKLTDAGGKYADGAIAQSDTLNGRLSTLQDNIDAVAREAGRLLTPTLLAVIKEANTALSQTPKFVEDIGLAFEYASDQLSPFLGGLERLQWFFTNLSPPGWAMQIVQGAGQRASQMIEFAAGQQRQAQKNNFIGPRAPEMQGPEVPERLRRRNQEPPALRLSRASGGAGGSRASAADSAARDAERLAEANAQKIASSKTELTLAQQLYEIEERILGARMDNVEPLVLARNAQKELATIRAEAAGIMADKELPAAAKANQLEKLRLQSAAVSRQLIFDIAQLEEQRKKAGQESLNTLADEYELLAAKLDGTEAEVILKQQLRDITKNMTPEQKQQAESLMQGIEAMKKQLELAEQMKQLYADIGLSIKDGVVSAIQGAIDGTKSLQEVAADLLRNIANQLLNVAVNLALFGAVSGTGTGGGLLGGLIKPRANGGSVTGGRPYLVGERGPELFMPGRSGGIAPTGSFGSGVNVVVNVDAKGTSVQGDQSQGAALGRAVSAAVQAELIKQQRPGGLLAR